MSEDEAVHTDLPPARFAELIADGAQLIDVRRPLEYEGGRIAGARNVDINELTAAADSLDRDRLVVFFLAAAATDPDRLAAFHERLGRVPPRGRDRGVADGHPLEPEGGEVRAPLPAS